MTSLQATSILTTSFSTATITEIEGNPNICGWYLFSVVTKENTSFRIYVTEEGVTIVVEVGNLFEEAKIVEAVQTHRKK